jgi:hypothetical protein
MLIICMHASKHSARLDVSVVHKQKPTTCVSCIIDLHSQKLVHLVQRAHMLVVKYSDVHLLDHITIRALRVL